MGKKKDKNDDIRIARQLCYPEIVIKKLKEEDDPDKRNNILHDARNGIYN